MRTKVEFSVPLVLDRLSQGLGQYEQMLSSLSQQNSNFNNSEAELRKCELRLTYLVKVCNSLFSYGLPSSGSKLPIKFANDNGNPVQVKTRYDDLTIVSRLIYLMKLLSDFKKHHSEVLTTVELELALVQSICLFKSSVLGDPRILLLGSTAAEEA